MIRVTLALVLAILFTSPCRADLLDLMKTKGRKVLFLGDSNTYSGLYIGYVEGSSRRRLPRLLADLDEIGLFVHDSIHTGRNLRFELDLALSALEAGGAVVSDDVHMNAAFQAYAGRGTLVCPSDDGAGLFGIIVRGIAVDAHRGHS